MSYLRLRNLSNLFISIVDEKSKAGMGRDVDKGFTCRHVVRGTQMEIPEVLAGDLDGDGKSK